MACIGLQVAGRMVKYSYYIARISSFIASKMQSSVTKNLVFPSCGDIKILQLMVSTFSRCKPYAEALACSAVANAAVRYTKCAQPGSKTQPQLMSA